MFPPLRLFVFIASVSGWQIMRGVLLLSVGFWLSQNHPWPWPNPHPHPNPNAVLHTNALRRYFPQFLRFALTYSYFRTSGRNSKLILLPFAPTGRWFRCINELGSQIAGKTFSNCMRKCEITIVYLNVFFILHSMSLGGGYDDTLNGAVEDAVSAGKG